MPATSYHTVARSPHRERRIPRRDTTSECSDPSLPWRNHHEPLPPTLTLLLILATCTQIAARDLPSETAVPATTPASRFQDNGDATVTDQSTGLMWVYAGGAVWFGFLRRWHGGHLHLGGGIDPGRGQWPGRVHGLAVAQHRGTLLHCRRTVRRPSHQLGCIPNTSASAFWSASPNASSSGDAESAWSTMAASATTATGAVAPTCPVGAFRTVICGFGLAGAERRRRLAQVPPRTAIPSPIAPGGTGEKIVSLPATLVLALLVHPAPPPAARRMANTKILLASPGRKSGHPFSCAGRTSTPAPTSMVIRPRPNRPISNTNRACLDPPGRGGATARRRSQRGHHRPDPADILYPETAP